MAPFRRVLQRVLLFWNVADRKRGRRAAAVFDRNQRWSYVRNRWITVKSQYWSLCWIVWTDHTCVTVSWTYTVCHWKWSSNLRSVVHVNAAVSRIRLRWSLPEVSCHSANFYSKVSCFIVTFISITVLLCCNAASAVTVSIRAHV